MAETAVHPRPHFSTFLQSDASAGGDALSYYRHKQYLRKNKTAILQARAGNLPTIQKPSGLEVKGEPAIPKQAPKSPTSVKFKEPATSPKPSAKPVNHFRSLTARPAGQFVRMNQPRLVKSASTHGRRSSWSVGDVPLMQTPRPKTAGNCSLDYKLPQSNVPPLLETTPEQLLPEQPPCKLGWITKSASENSTSSEAIARDEKAKHKRSQTVPAARVAAAADSGEATQTSKLSLSGVDSMTSINDMKPDEVEQLAKAYMYGTSTQRGYNEVGWHNKLPGPLPPPSTALEALPDQVSLRFTMKRYDAEPAQWQAIGTVWDYTQTRSCSYHKGPQSITYSSPNKKNQQIPGYSGHIGGGMDEVDDVNLEYKPTVTVHTHQPWHTKISRTANIPGYTGCVHWSNRLPAHSNMPKPEPASTARVHRALPLEENGSPFIRTGVLSKTVTLTSPYNHFNKIEH